MKVILETPFDTTASQLRGAADRHGRYDITVEKAGYVTWERKGVRVVRDGCTVRSEYFTAEPDEAARNLIQS